MDDTNDKLVAIVGCGLLSPVFDRADIRQEARLTDSEFDRLVGDLYDRGHIAFDVLQNRYLQ
jgi:hypothetical protein